MKAAVLGAGSIGTRHAQAMSERGWDVVLVPVSGIRGRTAPDGAKLIDEDALLSRAPELDVVVVATDTKRHIADTMSLARAGAARVLVEKPLGCSVDEVVGLDALPRTVQVGVAAPLRGTQAFQHIVELLRSSDDQQGSAQVVCQSWLPGWRPQRDYRDSYSADPSQGGVLRDMVHEIDYMQHLFGSPTLRGAELLVKGPLEINSDQSASLLVKFHDVAASFQLDYISRVPCRRLTLSLECMRVEWDLLSHQVRTTRADCAPEVVEFPQDADRNAAMFRQVDSFVSKDENHSSAHPTSLQVARDCLKLCDNARKFLI